MNNLSKAFENKKALIAIITGGDPDMETTEKLIFAMEEAGADIIGIGIPFSDPVGGPPVQQANERALAKGCTVDKLFEMVQNVRKKTNVPLFFMSYANSIFVYGKERFMEKCKANGIDGIAVPDVPFEENEEFSAECAAFGITQITMLTSATDERVNMIAKGAEGFVFGMPSSGGAGIKEMMTQVKNVTSTPCAVALNISTAEQARDILAVADGIIVDSAIVGIIAEHGKNCVEPVARFVRGIRG